MKSVANAMKVLQLFSEDVQSISVGDVSDHLGIPKSSASRLLATMRNSEIIQQDGRGGVYRLGVLARRLGAIHSSAVSARDIIRAGMQDLATEIRHSCWMSVLSGTHIVVLDGVHGGYPIRLVVEAGSQLPAHATAAGKALLARLDDERVRATFGPGPLAAFTPHTLTSVDALLGELALVRRQRWAQTRQEMIEGITSISASLLAPGETTAYALSISFPVVNVPEGDRQKLVDALVRAAARIGRRLGDPQWA